MRRASARDIIYLIGSILSDGIIHVCDCVSSLNRPENAYLLRSKTVNTIGSEV